MHYPDVAYFIEFLSQMTQKELSARYKNTVFGFLWMIINPLLQMTVIGVVFSFFVKEKIDNYFLFLFIGLLTWNFFTSSLSKCTPCILNERSLIKKAAFPRLIIPLSIIISNFVNYLISFGLLVPIAIIFGQLTIWSLPQAAVAFFLLMLFMVGISLFTAALNVRFRDVNFFIQALLIIWFYATPVIYPLAFIPENWRIFWYLNPLTAIVQLLQTAFIGNQNLTVSGIAITSFISIISFIVGLITFLREDRFFDDYV